MTFIFHKETYRERNYQANLASSPNIATSLESSPNIDANLSSASYLAAYLALTP